MKKIIHPDQVGWDAGIVLHSYNKKKKRHNSNAKPKQNEKTFISVEENKRPKYKFMWLQSSDIWHNYILEKRPTSSSANGAEKTGCRHVEELN